MVEGQEEVDPGAVPIVLGGVDPDDLVALLAEGIGAVQEATPFVLREGAVVDVSAVVREERSDGEGGSEVLEFVEEGGVGLIKLRAEEEESNAIGVFGPHMNSFFGFLPRPDSTLL
jgi:hypothetical protein